MAVINATQRNQTRNQSTLDISVENLFLFGNRYQTANFKNNTGATASFKSGFLVLRDTNTPAANIIPAIDVETLANVIGILKIDDVSLADTATASASYCISGDINVNALQLPAGVTLDTVVGKTGKCLRDLLTDLGFVLKNVTENSKFDN